ncbi:SpoIIE family protein phosphatase [Petroclostridium sp. X23]|uniref:SpoIIE family protein phosphatase n=1 Tax=Petroclostridium sp. X23 TaxID=3045146 RepID=UPI0024ADC235|nr:SpoIIE family protein phosphatase [Petroclostridium sp. X23]WHH61768.1 SpoIIE family protein phosphatase [Petroclostridium sp. X23]
MDRFAENTKEKDRENKIDVFDNSTLKVIMFACIVIFLAVLLTGGISYSVAKNAIITKLKAKDLKYIAQSITAKIDGRIQRAVETSRVLSEDPNVIRWLEDAEKDEMLGKHVMKKITDIARNYDYSNSFIVSSVTNHYWAEDGKLIDTMSADDEDDTWFFDTIASKQPISIVIDSNNERGDTFVFVNALMGDVNNPIAVTGVGLNLKDISEEVKGYKFGENSNMWLIDNKGDIYISEDVEQIRQNITSYIPEKIEKRLFSNNSNLAMNLEVLEYKNNNGQVYDLVYQPITATDWKLVLQVPRSESISIVNSIMINTGIACFITLLLVIVMFYMISHKIADPYKRTLLINRELEKKVDERTRELNEKNTKLVDSIEYAKMIQESILPPVEELAKLFKEYFILWKPKDIVGGDFYYTRRLDKGYIAAVGDCTGHGVPGALMTMTVNSILNHIVDEICNDNPAVILKELNRLLKQALRGRNSIRALDDGLDGMILYISEHGEMLFAGAKASLYYTDKSGVHFVKGNNKGIGYEKTTEEYEFECVNIEFDDESVFYITTDGFLDQNGDGNQYSFGRKRFEVIISECMNLNLGQQKDIFEKKLQSYMGSELQRDDITVLVFKPYTPKARSTYAED